MKAKLDEIKGYAPAPGVPAEKLLQMARLGVVLSRWMEANAIDATAIQCWTSVQQNFGCNVCTLMSMMSEKFMPSACEVDVTGVLTMYAMQLAADSPAALVDWNNNYGDDDDKCVLFHCGNWAKSFLPDIKIANAPILGSTLGVENTYGALEGRTPAGPLTYGRVTTADADGVHPRLRRRRRTDQRQARDLRHPRRRPRAAAAEAAALRLRATASSITSS